MQIPESKSLPVNLLAACFNNKVATYKYYWFLSVIQEIEKGNFLIKKRNLFAKMISNAWYTVNYFHVSFGKQDLIQEAVHFIKESEKITIDEDKEKVFQKIISSKNKLTEKQLWHFNKNVPHWFLSPWFPKTNQWDVYRKSKLFENECLYSLDKDEIEINPRWKYYLIANAGILKDFCYWNLALFLQSRNPNVPDIPNKLIKPAKRKKLEEQKKMFWNLVIETSKVKCIYTGEEITVGNYALEHFIPHSFVSHDLIWNLIPANSSYNSTKSDKLPSLDKYFKPFYELQKSAVEIIRAKTPKNKYLEDYLTILPDYTESFTESRFRETIQPLITIASNNGFEFLHESIQ
jgi:5-methylcytosine-specific restriction endonuclease McrA